MNPSNQVDRAIILSSVVYIGLLGFALTPVIHTLAVSLLPIPLIVLTKKAIRWAPIALATISTLLFVALGYGWFAALYGLAIYYVGWSMGEALRTKQSPYMALVHGTFVFVMLEVVQLAMYKWLGYNLYADFKSALLEGLRQNPSISPDTLDSLVSTLVDQTRLLTPGILCVVGFLTATANLLGAKVLLGFQTVATGLLRDYRLPQTIVPVYVAALTVVLFQWGENSYFWWQVCNNLTFVAGFFIGIQGLAMIWRNVKRESTKCLLIVFMTLLAPVPFVRSVSIFLGLLDMLNRRRRSE